MYTKRQRQDKIILTDIDGVVLDWEFAFTQWMETQGHDLQNKNSYYIDKAFDLSSGKAGRLVHTFNESAAIGFLPPLRDSQYYIKKLHEKYQYRFIAITSLSLNPYAKKLRVKNLNKLFGSNAFKKVICLGCGAPKDEALAKAAEEYPGAVWIEDKMVNADLGVSLGLDTLLMSHGHNIDYQGSAIPVRNWEEVYRHIKWGYQ